MTDEPKTESKVDRAARSGFLLFAAIITAIHLIATGAAISGGDVFEAERFLITEVFYVLGTGIIGAIAFGVMQGFVEQEERGG